MMSFERPDERIAVDLDRIEMEIVMNCYDEVEQASGWYCHLESNLTFPFTARCDGERSISPLREGETVVVTEMADIDDCMSEIVVVVEWQDREFGTLLAQLVPVDVDSNTEQTVGEWRYWDQRGYQIS